MTRRTALIVFCAMASLGHAGDLSSGSDPLEAYPGADAVDDGGIDCGGVVLVRAMHLRIRRSGGGAAWIHGAEPSESVDGEADVGQILRADRLDCDGVNCRVARTVLWLGSSGWPAC